MTNAAKRVLIAEAHRVPAVDLEETLQKLGYDVVASVSSGEAAIEEAVRKSPDLALMAVRLRGAMDGIQAASAIHKRIDIPIIYLTEYADEETVQRAMLTGPFGFLVKPFNERELRATIEVAIHKHATDRALAEERARRESAEEFKLFVECVEDYAIFVMDVSGRVVSWNTGAARIKGYTAHEVIGRHFSIFYPEEQRRAGKPQEELDRARATGRSESEGWLLRKDGSSFLATTLITARRDESGELVGFANVTRDITQRRQAERALIEHAARMSAMIEGSLDAIVSIDLGGRVLEWNPAAEHLFGYAREEALGQNMAELIIPERLRSKHREGLEAYARTGHGPMLGKHVELPAITRDGSPRTVELSIVRIPAEGPPIFTGFARDITDRKAVSKERARLYEEAQQAIRARDEFLAIASHELRTPLSALVLELATLERSLRGLRDEANPKITAKVAKASKITERLARLIERLLDVSRVTTGRLQLNLEPVNLSELVRDQVDRFSDEARRSASKLEVEIAPGATGQWDRTRLEQVLANLLSNAVKYGSGAPIHVKLGMDTERVVLSVRDHGIGISAEDISRIFDRFERAVPSRHYGGLGLGLYITRQIVEAHGGRIGVESSPGNGSAFTVTLPRRAQARELERRSQPVEAGP